MEQISHQRIPLLPKIVDNHYRGIKLSQYAFLLITAVTIVPTDAAVVDRVTRSLAVVQTLGGIERAEKIAEAHAFRSGT